MMFDHEADALRDGMQAAQARHAAQMEMESSLAANEQRDQGVDEARDEYGVSPSYSVDFTAPDRRPPDSIYLQEADYLEVPEYRDHERTFAGDGPHSLAELDNGDHALETVVDHDAHVRTDSNDL
ncbi:MAG: hypothetical protein H7123_01430 [Thermoleophilia bacterium]|nr:hypothetical protein [Thermoleophilia bacterium]